MVLNCAAYASDPFRNYHNNRRPVEKPLPDNGQSSTNFEFITDFTLKKRGFTVEDCKDMCLCPTLNQQRDPNVVKLIIHGIQSVLKQAKICQFSCKTTIRIPKDVLPLIAQEILVRSQHEVCGIRGCTIRVFYVDEKKHREELGKFQIDDEIVSTFEFLLVFYRAVSSWSSAFSALFGKSYGSHTIALDSSFELILRKLYRSSSIPECEIFAACDESVS